MSTNQNEKSVTLTIYPMTFIDLELRSEDLGKNLGDLYVEAVGKYVSDCKPDRLKVFAAPGAGKRIRVNLDRGLYYDLLKKIGNSGVNMKDAVYTALEYYLDQELEAVAA